MSGDENVSKDNKTIYAILGLLHHEPFSGYDIRKRIETSVGYFWDAGYGQIYPALRKMAAAGLVTSETEKNEGRPDRKVHALTEKGRLELHKWLEEPAAREYVRYEILLKLFFGSLVPAKRNRHPSRPAPSAMKVSGSRAAILAGSTSNLRGANRPLRTRSQYA